MSELIDLAFLFCSRAKDKGLKKYDILWLAEQQIERLYRIEHLKKIEDEFFRSEKQYGKRQYCK